MNPFALPVHPAVVHFPIAMLVSAWVCLVVAYAKGWEAWDRQGRVLEVIGVAGLPLAIVAGLIDTRGIEFLTRPRWDAPLIWHAAIGVTTTALFAAHLVWSRRVVARGFAFAVVDLGAVTAGVWLLVLGGLIGAEMVYAA